MSKLKTKKCRLWKQTKLQKSFETREERVRAVGRVLKERTASSQNLGRMIGLRGRG